MAIEYTASSISYNNQLSGLLGSGYGYTLLEKEIVYYKGLYEDTRQQMDYINLERLKIQKENNKLKFLLEFYKDCNCEHDKEVHLDRCIILGCECEAKWPEETEDFIHIPTSTTAIPPPYTTTTGPIFTSSSLKLP